MQEVVARLPRRPRWLATLGPPLLAAWGFVAVFLLQVRIDGENEGRLGERAMQELAYFPSGRFVRQAAIEYEDVAADFIWLRAVQYYGHHLMTDRKYEWLGHVFGILTTLDPRFTGAYHFGAITLAWDAREPEQALDLLAAGMAANPMNWQLPFDAGFISYMLLRDYEKAGRLFEIASKLPNAWQLTARWAAVATAKAGDFETARQLWVDLYNSSQNKRLRELVVRQLRLLKLEEEIQALQQAVMRFREKEGRLPTGLDELVGRGYVRGVPSDPFGGHFYLDGDSVRTSTPPGRLQ
jgi:tetratricopeptide (TPR) repeat protein